MDVDFGGGGRGPEDSTEGGGRCCVEAAPGSWRMVLKQRFPIGYHCSTRHPIVLDNRWNLCIGGGPTPRGKAGLGQGDKRA